MNRTAARLVEMGAEPPRIIAWGERPGDDAVDFFQRGGTAEDVRLIMKAAVQYSPADPTPAPLDEVRSFVARYVVATPYQLDAVALWVAHAHAIEAAETTPYLSIRSPENRSGKSRLQEVLDLLVPNPLNPHFPDQPRGSVVIR